MLNFTEDAHIRNVSTFETYEHLRDYSFGPAFVRRNSSETAIVQCSIMDYMST
jgi:hypothetical protein